MLTSWFANVVEIWNPATGESIAAYHDFAVPLNAIRFQGDLIVAGDIDNVLIGLCYC